MVHAFRDCELDEERFELRRAGSPVRVEPRVLEVLSYLVKNRGRVVAKEELLDHVWKKTFVGESALTRCIMESRRAIGDADRNEPLIRTVHGRGYRFEDVVTTNPVIPDAVEVPNATDVTEGGLIARHGGGEVTAGAEVVPAGEEKSAGYKPALLAALGVVFAIVLAAWYFRPAPSAAQPPIIRVALLPISAAGEEKELQLVGMSITDLLEERLSRIPRVRVRGADYSGPLSVDAATLAELAKRAGVERVISGTVRMAGDKARLELTLHDVGAAVRDTPLGHYEIPLLRGSADIRHYAVLRDRLVAQVVDTLQPAFSATPRDFDAYRLYLLARQRLARGTCDGEAAIELLRRSIELDPNYAPAWDAYGWAHYRLSSACGGGSRHYAEALDGARRALKLAPGIGSAVALQARVLMESGKLAEALRIVNAALRNHPDDADLQFSLASALAHSGRIDESRAALDRLRANDPSYLAQKGVAPMAYLYAGDTRRFLAELPVTDAPLFRYHRGFVAWTEGRREEAWRALEPAFRSNPADVHARLSQALLSIIDRRPDESREILHQLARERALVGATDGEMTYRIAQLEAMAGDTAAALRDVRSAVGQGFLCKVYMRRDPALASLRTADEFVRIVSSR
jgi:DNA-binding winged helix-turn-helix (wHTH) protein/tetratricopeptide (TPR) repeat protein